VQFSRLEAKSLALQGRFDEAVSLGRQGRFCLCGDEDDAFSAQMLDWLLAAGQQAEAAHIAFECVDNERVVSAEHACHLAIQQLQEPAAHQALWALVLASAALWEDTQWVCGDEDPAQYLQRHLALAGALPALQPTIDVLQARHLVQSQEDYAQALPLLERTLQNPALASSKNLEQLWLCRIQVHGAEEALALPFIPATAAGWCYNLGVHLDYNLQAQLPEDMDWPEAAVEHLAARYYEAGLARFEAFFATGQGQYRDGDIHVYAMLCNNLAIYYRATVKKYDLAIATHNKGIAASPFAEHYDGLMRCQQASGNQAGFVEAADRLWHFAAEHGYSRHFPNYYIDGVSNALHDLGRLHEVAIWLQRLEEWWNSLDQDEQAEEEAVFLSALACVLTNLALVQPDDALARLQTALPRFRASKRADLVRIAGLVYENAGQLEQAVQLFQEALTLVQADRDGDDEQHESAQRGIKRCKKQQRAGRNWWQFWK